MVLCATCRVNTIDRHCTNTPRSCYLCCTSHADIPTCPRHYQQMGVSDAAARLAAGLVHPSIADGDEEDTSPAPAELHPAPPGESDSQHAAGSPPDESAPPASGLATEAAQAGLRSAAPPQPTPAASAAAAAASAFKSSLAAMRAELESDRAAAHVERAAAQAERSALQARLDKQAASTQQILTMLAALRPTAAPATSTPSPTVPSRQPLQSVPASATAPAARPAELPRTSSTTSPPHQAALLDREAAATRSEVAQLVNRFSALANDDDSDDDVQVLQQPHTSSMHPSPAARLPAAFIPTAPGTAQSAQQQLAAIVNGLSKQSSKVKYTTVAELNEALDDWVADSIRAGTWTLAQVESIRAYQRLLIVRFSISERRPLKEVLEYHRRWCKAVHAGTIDMFAPGAEFSWPVLYEVSNPLQLGTGHTPTASTPRAGNSKAKDASPAVKAGAASGSPAAKHPAGSCTNHPTSTSHTTAECKKK